MAVMVLEGWCSTGGGDGVPGMVVMVLVEHQKHPCGILGSH